MVTSEVAGVSYHTTDQLDTVQSLRCCDQQQFTTVINDVLSSLSLPSLPTLSLLPEVSPVMCKHFDQSSHACTRKGHKRSIACFLAACIKLEFCLFTLFPQTLTSSTTISLSPGGQQTEGRVVVKVVEGGRVAD